MTTRKGLCKNTWKGVQRRTEGVAMTCGGAKGIVSYPKMTSKGPYVWFRWEKNTEKNNYLSFML